MITLTLARYVGLRFVISVLTVAVLFLVIIFMVDLIENLREAGKSDGVDLSAVIMVTLLRIPSYAELTLPFMVLIGSIGAFLTLSRSSELVVMRASGVSVWQFLAPAVVIAGLIGFAANSLISPLASSFRGMADRLQSEIYGREQNILRTKNAGSWLRQNGADGSSVISAALAANGGLSLTDVSVLQFDAKGRFVERVDAARAELRDSYWELADAWVSRTGSPPERFGVYHLSTYLTAEEANDTLGSVSTLSYAELPGAIQLAEKAGLSATRYRVQFALMQARPVLFAAMVLLAATVSLRTFRFGSVQTRVVWGVVAGFGFFILSEISRQIGVAGTVSAWTAAWVPAAVAGFLSLTVLLHQEDG